MKEVEVKARLRDKDALVAKLTDLGCMLSAPIRQDDTLYAAIDKPITEFTIGDLVMRIRRQGSTAILTGKIPVTNHLDKLESETEVSDAAAMEQLLEWMDFKKIMTLSKLRQKTRHGEYEICVDEVAGLGSFIEVEKMTDEDGDVAQAELWDFLKTLGIEESARVTKGYDQLLGEQVAAP